MREQAQNSTAGHSETPLGVTNWDSVAPGVLWPLKIFSQGSVFLHQIMPSSWSWLLVPSKNIWGEEINLANTNTKYGMVHRCSRAGVFIVCGWILLTQVISWVVVVRSHSVFQISLFLHLFPLTWKIPVCSIWAFLNNAYLVLFTRMSSFRQQKDRSPLRDKSKSWQKEHRSFKHQSHIGEVEMKHLNRNE